MFYTAPRRREPPQEEMGYMRILLYCNTTQESIPTRLGTPDYSYWYVLKAFRPVLETLGTVEVLEDPTLADPIWSLCQARGEACALLSFAPPHRTPLGLRCPTIPVFAWEYPNLPKGTDEMCWRDDARNDWQYVFDNVAGAITLSHHTVRAVTGSIGPHYPIAAIPTPTWDRCESTRNRLASLPDVPLRRVLHLSQVRVVDSYLLGLSADGMIEPNHEDGTPFAPDDEQMLPPRPTGVHNPWADLPPRPAVLTEIGQAASTESATAPSGWALPDLLDIRLPLDGVVYTSVLTPSDGRKNWEDIVSAFAWAFRDVEDAVLLLKLGGENLGKRHHEMVALLSKLSPFKCRVLAIHGYVDPQGYEDLIASTDYYVNGSLCEGLCMPLLEYLSCGVPAIAPSHTSMADYMDAELGFVVASSEGQPVVWPHGDHVFDRTSYGRLDWHSMMLAYRASYVTAKGDVARYAAMSAHALERMQSYCSDAAIKPRISDFIAGRIAAHAAEPAAAKVASAQRP